MRIALPMGRRVYVALALLAALIAALPARVVAGWLDLDAIGFAAREVSGPIWTARASEAQLGGLPLGDLDLALDPLPLLIGRARLTLGGAGAGAGEPGVRGSVTVSRHRLAVRGDGWRVETGARLAPLPVAAIGFDGLDARFRDGLCEVAEGGARVERAGDPLGLGLPASMAGPVRCEAGALVLALTGASGAERLTIGFSAGGRYHAELAVRPGDPAAGGRLAAAGFAARGVDNVLAIDGRW